MLENTEGAIKKWTCREYRRGNNKMDNPEKLAT